MIGFDVRGAGFSDRHLHVTVTLHETTVDLGLLDKSETRSLGIELVRAVDELFEHSGVLDYTDTKIRELLRAAEVDD